MPIAPEHLALLYTGPFDAYLYGRASRDPKKKGRSVNTQLDEGRSLCIENEWPIKREFRDVDRSASRYAKKAREEFEEMIDGIESGDCRILVAWEASRYYRDLEVYIRLRNACMANGVLLCYNGTVYDLSKRSDRKATAQDALQAEDEADGIRDRNLRTVRKSASTGAPHGRILWGYARRYDPDTGDLVEQYPHPDRAPIVLQVFERIAAGETGYAILQDLRATGERLPGIRWEQHHLTSMVRNIGYKGRRLFQGKDVGKASWDAIVDDDLFDAVQQIVRAPERRTANSWAAVHLLSGIARCGRCPDAPHLKILNNRGGILSYQCSERYDVVIAEAKMDAYVEEAVIEYLESKAAIAAFASTDDQKRTAAARQRLKQLQGQLDDARGQAGKLGPTGTPLLSIASLAALEASLTPQIEEAKAASEVLHVPPVLRGVIGRPDVDSIWQEMSIEQRRAVLRAVVNVRLMKARVSGLRKIEPGRIVLTFYGEPGFVSAWRRGRVTAPAPDAGAPQD
ncbi:recombinase family protein [Streptomyces sp. OUCMDZ-4982]|uniref:recombinase family protein n=1 Tax=Streptomyces sp. OUCMDZ-4982 TaxID=2973090 RepID=UPI00215C602F|nr:recombinase family protein [Streptomyces sp. OUCMDZ-4982]MCR8946585.1 recombinase family protein [Streptomyces sp. OUCMDZ-4982]